MELNVVFAGNPSFPNGGAMTKRWRYMIDHMNDSGISSHVMCTSIDIQSIKNNPFIGLYRKTDFINIICGVKKNNFLKFIRLGRTYLRKWYDPQKKNIIIFNTILDLWEIPLCIYALYLGYKLVFDVVETSYRLNGHTSTKYKIKMFINESIIGFFYNKGSSIVISSALMNTMKNSYPKMNLCLIPNSTPILNKKKKNKFNDPIILLYAGTFSEKDGVKYLINGVIKAYNEGVCCRLDLYGKGNDFDMKVLDLAVGKNYIVYHGFVGDDELQESMNNADILCMTRCNSVFANYGFPFKLSEYLAAGNIVIATRVGDVEKYIIDKQNAYLIEPENSQAIADVILHISRNTHEALQIANNAQSVVDKYFNIQINGEKLINFLYEI